MNKAVRIRVPATTANLGPGFDCLGLALGLYDEFEFSLREKEIIFENCPPEFANENHLSLIAYRAMAEELSLPRDGFRLRMAGSDIPAARGLGSSAALRVAGAAAAYCLHGLKPDKEKILEVCTKLEGHPDNVTPAIFGGMTAAFREDERVFYSRVIPSGKFHWVLVIPSVLLPTEKARAVLPEAVLFCDAVYNLSRTAVLLQAAGRGDDKLLSAAMRDRLHQEKRKALIPEYDRIQTAAESLGALAVCLSGAGPSILAVAKEKAFAAKLQKVLPDTFTVTDLPCDALGLRIKSI